MRQINFIFTVIISFGFFPEVFAKKHCDSLLEKLHHVQSLQRQSYSAKEGISLRKREDTARERWWQCEKGSGKNKIKKKKKKANKKTTKKKNKDINVVASFKSSNAIVIKSKYQGDKKQAWLKYYQQPDDCIKPKSLPAFAVCIENKQNQRADFEKLYNAQ